MRPTIALACLLASITLGALTQCTTFAQSPSSCQLRVLTEDESGVLVSVDGVAVKERSTGKTIQPASLLAPGVIAFDGIRSGYYVITAAKTGFKRTAHTSHLQCDRSFVGVTVVLYPGKPNEIVESGTPLPDLPLSEDQSTPTQKRTAPESSDYVQNRSPGPLRSAEDDPGVDVGVVIATKANLREGPSTTSAVIRELQRGNILALINRVSVGPWYNVIHIQSSTEGWINGNTIKVNTRKRGRLAQSSKNERRGQVRIPQLRLQMIRM